MAVKGKKAAANTAKTKATVKNQQCYNSAANPRLHARRRLFLQLQERVR